VDIGEDASMTSQEVGIAEDAGELEQRPHSHDRHDLFAQCILVICGVGLVAIAIVFRASATIASPGIVLGCLLIVLGVFLPRIEWLKLSATGLEAKLRAAQQIQRIASRDRGIPQDKREEIAEAAVFNFITDSSVNDVPGERLSDVAQETYAVVRTEFLAFESRVQQWLEQEGWLVEETSGRGPVDFVARRGDEVMLVEAKVFRSPVTRDSVLDAIDRLRRAARRMTGRDPARALFMMNAPKLTPAAVHAVIMSGTRVYRDAEDKGGFERVDLGTET